MLALLCYSKSVTSQVNVITPCNSFDIGKHYLVAERKFTSKATGKRIDFKPYFGVHKSDIKTKKERCCTSRHFNEKCLCPASPFGYVKVQIIERVLSEDSSNIEEVLWYRERYLQSQLRAVTRGMNSINDLYCKKRKGYRKEVLVSTINC